MQEKQKTSLYIHIPFCAKKCLFCSFVIAVGQEHRRDQYIDCLLKEMSCYQGVSLQTIYIGGGTPTLLTAEQWKRLFHKIRETFHVMPDVEITVEANPEGLTSTTLSVLKQCGVTRLSMGVQSWDNRYLMFLGRCHDAATAEQALLNARTQGFHNINLDLMYSFPGQTEDELRVDVATLIAHEPEHVSLYSLTIEPRSRFYAEALLLDDLDKLAQDYLLIENLLKEAGYEQYEISNFSKPGYRSCHNQEYWLGGSYIGLGVGAHGYWNGTRYWNVDRLADYMKKVNDDTSVRAGDEKILPTTHLYELLVFGLRMNDGVDLDEIEQQAGCALSDDQQEVLRMLREEGLLMNKGRRWWCGAEGRYRLDDIAVRLVR